MNEEIQWGYTVNITGKGDEYYIAPSSDRESAESMVAMYQRIADAKVASINWKVNPKLIKRRILVDEWEVVD